VKIACSMCVNTFTVSDKNALKYKHGIVLKLV